MGVPVAELWASLGQSARVGQQAPALRGALREFARRGVDGLGAGPGRRAHQRLQERVVAVVVDAFAPSEVGAEVVGVVAVGRRGRNGHRFHVHEAGPTRLPEAARSIVPMVAAHSGRRDLLPDGLRLSGTSRAGRLPPVVAELALPRFDAIDRVGSRWSEIATPRNGKVPVQTSLTGECMVDKFKLSVLGAAVALTFTTATAAVAAPRFVHRRRRGQRASRQPGGADHRRRRQVDTDVARHRARGGLVRSSRLRRRGEADRGRAVSGDQRREAVKPGNRCASRSTRTLAIRPSVATTTRASTCSGAARRSTSPAPGTRATAARARPSPCSTPASPARIRTSRPNLLLSESTSFVAGEGVCHPSSMRFNHGTHVAGIIAAPDNGIGTIGVAPEAKILRSRCCPTPAAATSAGSSRASSMPPTTAPTSST